MSVKPAQPVNLSDKGIFLSLQVWEHTNKKEKQVVMDFTEPVLQWKRDWHVEKGSWAAALTVIGHLCTKGKAEPVMQQALAVRHNSLPAFQQIALTEHFKNMVLESCCSWSVNTPLFLQRNSARSKILTWPKPTLQISVCLERCF